MTEKKRIVKDYDQLPDDVLMKLKMQYPNGFSEHLIKFTNAQGKKVSALPFETDTIYYLIRMTAEEAIQIIEDDEDYDEFGNLSVGEGDEYGNEDGNEEEEAENIADDAEEPDFD
ncbi:MAG: hypothetical protein OHK0053_22180 [Microscillaceae bacterium]